MMTMTNTNIAIVQFGYKDNENELKKISKSLEKEGIAHWYFFDETADKEFEVEALRPFYRGGIFECIDIDDFEEIK